MFRQKKVDPEVRHLAIAYCEEKNRSSPYQLVSPDILMLKAYRRIFKEEALLNGETLMLIRKAVKIAAAAGFDAAKVGKV